MRIRWIDRSAERKLKAAMLAVSGPALAAVVKTQYAEQTRNRIQRRFASEGDEVSGKWAPLQPATERWREKLGYPPAHPINVRTGEMRRWATTSTYRSLIVSADTFAGVYPAETPSGELFDKVRLAQEGSSGFIDEQTGRDSQPIPERPILGYGGNDLAALLTIMSNHLVQVITYA